MLEVGELQGVRGGEGTGCLGRGRIHCVMGGVGEVQGARGEERQGEGGRERVGGRERKMKQIERKREG